MLLSEQERILASEKNLINSSTSYAIPSTSWGLINDYGSITTPAAGIVFFNFAASAGLGASGTIGLYINGIPVEVVKISAETNIVEGGAVWLPQGSYDVQFQGLYSGSQPSITSLQVGFTQFNDCTSYALQSSTQGGTINLTVPARTTPVGPLNEAVFAINLSAQAPVNQLVSPEPITVDGVSYALDETGPTAYATSGKLYIPLSVGVQHTISCTTGNANATMYVSIIACPWILTTAAHQHQPVTLDFPQQSTFYAIVDPLFLDAPLKECFIGKPKGVTFGPEDYYGYASAGTGATVSFNYEFESVNTLSVIMSADGLGCCIDNIAVDEV